MPPRLSPLKDACHHVGLKIDKTRKLDVKFINAVKGRGLFAVGSFCKGDFVVEYRGDLIDDAEAERRKVYHPSCAAFFFLFKWRGKAWCIDASREDGSFGRIVNDEHRHPNCRMKKIEVEGKQHLCPFAIKDIKDGEEITYDYGGDDCPWRMQTLHDISNESENILTRLRRTKSIIKTLWAVMRKMDADRMDIIHLLLMTHQQRKLLQMWAVKTPQWARHTKSHQQRG